MKDDIQKNKIIPDFIIPGFAKSGTSSLHEYLNQHPSIKMSSIKEPHNYSNLKHYEQRFDSSFQFSFNNLFTNANDSELLGESSTSYSICDYSPKLIYKDNPNMKFIIIARDPTERIRSHYNWLLSLGQVENDFRDEIHTWLNEKFDINNPVRYGYKYYTETSKYGKQLSNYLNYFSIDNFHFLSTEKLKTNPKEELKKCFSFLNVDDYPHINPIKTNQTKAVIPKYDVPKRIRFFKYLIPLSLRLSLKKTVGKKYILKNQIEAIKELSDKDVEWLHSILQEDINLFKKLSGNDFKEWQHF